MDGGAAPTTQPAAADEHPTARLESILETIGTNYFETKQRLKLQCQVYTEEAASRTMESTARMTAARNTIMMNITQSLCEQRIHALRVGAALSAGGVAGLAAGPVAAVVAGAVTFITFDGEGSKLLLEALGWDAISTVEVRAEALLEFSALATSQSGRPPPY